MWKRVTKIARSFKKTNKTSSAEEKAVLDWEEKY